MRRGLWLLCLCLAGCSSEDAAVRHVVSLTPVLDNTLVENEAGARSNGSGSSFYAGVISQGTVRRALLAFAVADSIPPGAKVEEAVLRLHLTNTSDAAVRTMTLHRVLAGWGEGDSRATGGIGAPSDTGDATWIHRFYPDVLWEEAGGSFEAVVSGSAMVQTLGDYSWTGEGMAGDVQRWVDDPSTDHGWLLAGDETEAHTARGFASREAAVPGERPRLTVVYSTPAGKPGTAAPPRLRSSR